MKDNMLETNTGYRVQILEGERVVYEIGAQSLNGAFIEVGTLRKGCEARYGALITYPNGDSYRIVNYKAVGQNEL